MKKIENHHLFVESRKELVRKNIKISEINDILLDLINEFNIKFKNEESKIIAKKYLYALKLSKVNEKKIRIELYKRIKERFDCSDILDIDNILDSFIITYKGINKINYIYINY